MKRQRVQMKTLLEELLTMGQLVKMKARTMIMPFYLTCTYCVPWWRCNTLFSYQQ